MTGKTLLMIPGPVELSPGVLEVLNNAPPSHVAPAFIEKFGQSLKMMREVWGAGAGSQPFIIAGSGTIAMEVAVVNTLAAGQRALVVHTGYFSARMAEMLRRRGALVTELSAAPGQAPSVEELERALDQAQAAGEPFHALFATHVDTSTGVRVEAEAIARAAKERGVLSVFDGVCATAGEDFKMEEWGADIYLTASQKALGAPPGLALLVLSERALRARQELSSAPPMSLDIEQWLPVMRAYEAGRGSYFSTPATSLLLALHQGLKEVVGFERFGARGAPARIRAHAQVGRAMRAGWSALGLELFSGSPEIAANTMSAVLYPAGVDSSLLGAIKKRGVVVAGGLYPGREQDYFRVGHMGYMVERPDLLLQTLRAVGESLIEAGFSADLDAGLNAARACF